MRNISFSLTEPQFRARTKTVTRRIGWLHAKPGDLLCGVRKSQGLKPGEKLVRLGVIRVVSARRERLDALLVENASMEEQAAECAREGFPEFGLWGVFVQMFQKHMGCAHGDLVTRIEFEYVEA